MSVSSEEERNRKKGAHEDSGEPEEPDGRPDADEETTKEGAREKISDGVRQGLGVLSAFKDALEETIQEARERGELSSDRAKGVMRDAMSRMREAAGDARERLDFASQEDFDHLKDEVAELRVRLENLEHRVPQDENVGPSRPAESEPDEETEGEV